MTVDWIVAFLASHRRRAIWLGLVAWFTTCGPVAVHAAPFVPPRDAHCVALSPDGKLALIGYSGQSNSEFPPRPHPSPRKTAVVQLFDIATQKRLRRIETFGDLTRVAFSPDGSLFAASRLFTTNDGVELNEVRVWETATGKVQHVFDRCHGFSFSPTRGEMVVASRKRCVAYALATGEKHAQFPHLADAIRVQHWPDGTSLVGICQVAAGFVMRRVSVSDGVVLAESPPLPDPFYSLAIPHSPPALGPGKLATGHAQGLILLWDPTSLQPVARLRTGGSGRAHPFFSPSGQLLAAADQANSDVVVWEADSGREVVRYTFKQGSLHTYGSKAESRVVRPEEDPARFVFSPDGESFLGGPYGGILRLVTSGRDIARFGE